MGSDLHKGSLWGEGNFLKLDCSDGYTTLDLITVIELTLEKVNLMVYE